MNALLLYPELPDTFWSFKHALSFVGKRASLPPLGLLTVAAMLPPAWQSRLIDLNLRGLRSADLAWADLVFLSAMNVQRDAAREIIDQCRQARVPVVAGGPLFTTEHERFADVEHLVLDEAEITLPRFLDDLSRGRPRSIYRAGAFAELQDSPRPAWELIDVGDYATLSLQYSRGCPFSCEFCSVTSLLGRKVRTKTTDQVIAELDAIHRSGWRGGIFIVDDNFIAGRKQLKEVLLPAMIDWRQDHPGGALLTQSSIDLADDEELTQLMVRAGFDTVFIGVETPDQASLRECGKSQNRGRDVVRDVRRIHRAGLQVQGGFIVGFDSDELSIFDRQIAMIQSSGIVTAMVGLLQALPGTRLFERLRGEGRLVGETSGDNVDGTTNILPRMNLEALHAGYRRILGHIYAPRHYYFRIRAFLRDYRLAPIRPASTLADYRAFLLSIARLGILGRERLHYWRLLLWTLLHHPRKLSLAVTLAIYGYHFRRVSEHHVRTAGG